MYNKTQLTPKNEFEKHIYHRDQFAHYFRWTHVLKNAKIGQKILDMGCGSGEMIEVFYRNRYRPEKFVGIDIRDKVPEKLKNLDFVEILVKDLCKPFDLEEKFDIITSFEVVEHIGHENLDAYLQNMVKHCKQGTKIFLSTPNYDPIVGAAKNHMLTNSKGELEVGEWNHLELGAKLEKYFTIKDNSPKKDCTISIDDSAVDVNTLGIYEVSYVASDASGNKTEGQVDVEVIEPMEDYEKIAVNLIDSIRDILKNPESLQIRAHRLATRSF